MNLRELDFPVRVYWDLFPAPNEGTLDYMRVCEDILEIKVLSLGLSQAGFPLSPPCIKILERLRNENMAVSLTISGPAFDSSSAEILNDLNVKTLFIEASSLDELITSLYPPFKSPLPPFIEVIPPPPPLEKGGWGDLKGVRGNFFGISFNVNSNNYKEIPDVLSFCIKNEIKYLVFPMQRLISELPHGKLRGIRTKQLSEDLSFRLVRNLSEEGLPTSGNDSNKQQYVQSDAEHRGILSINGSDCFYINKKEREELARKLNKINHENIKLIIHDPFLWRVFYPSINFPGGGCQAANSMIYISPDGIIYPCPSMPVKLGDLKTQKLKEIILSPRKKELRKNLCIPPEECIDCNEQKQCMGGCRGRAYVLKGSLGYKDPACG